MCSSLTASGRDKNNARSLKSDCETLMRSPIIGVLSGVAIVRKQASPRIVAKANPAVLSLNMQYAAQPLFVTVIELTMPAAKYR
jgi:hypothetical protein